MNRDWKDALERRDLATIDALSGLDGNLNARDEHGQTGLMNAARRGDADVVELLVSRGADLNVAAKYGLTALMLAVVNGHTQVAHLLVQAGADVSCKGTGAPGFAGKTAQDLARARGQDEVIALLQQRSGTK
jgi:ankyrin repeat protein